MAKEDELMAGTMRALYYINLMGESGAKTKLEAEEKVKANENCLNQNFTILQQTIAELEARIASIES